MDSRYIVALEIGSSKITGAVAKVDPDTADIKVLALDSIPLINSVRYGRVQNVQEVSTTANEIIRKLENNPAVMPRHISQIFISLGGRSFSTVNTTGALQLPGEIEIKPETIERLKREATFDIATNKEQVILEPRKFFVDNAEVKNIVGTFGQNIRGEFTAVVCSPENKRNLERVKLTDLDSPARHYVPRAIAISDMVLTPTEKQLGCVMMDFGAETTTVAIYKDGKLQFISTVPLGGRNITLDLMIGLKETEERSEFHKKTIGTAVNEHPEASNGDQLIDNYIQARLGEIVANALNQLNVAGFKTADLPAGAVIVGGASKITNFLKFFTAQSKLKAHYGDIDNAVKMLDGKIRVTDHLDVIAALRYAARTTTDNCLEGTDPELEESMHRFNNDRTSDYNDDYNAGYRRANIPSEDDDDLLRDDDDANDRRPSEPAKPKKRFSLFGHRKDKQKSDEAEEFDQAETYTNDNYNNEPDGYEDDYEDDDYEDEPDDERFDQGYQNSNEDRNKSRTSFLNRIQNFGTRFFGNVDAEK
jgi:cell division protein FtsA